MPSVEGFFDYEVRVGTVTEADDFPEARRPAYRLRIDLGPDVGERRSSARICDLYRPDALVGRQVVCVVNLPARRIGPFVSEVLVLGFATPDGVVLAGPDRRVPDGTRIS